MELFCLVVEIPSLRDKLEDAHQTTSGVELLAEVLWKIEVVQ